MASTQSDAPHPDEDYCTPQQVHVSPGSPAATSLHVFWVTNYNCTSIVMYGTTPDAFAASATFGLPPTRYRIDAAAASDDAAAIATNDSAGDDDSVESDHTSSQERSSNGKRLDIASAHGTEDSTAPLGREVSSSDSHGCVDDCDGSSSSDSSSSSSGSSSSGSGSSSGRSGSSSSSSSGRRNLGSASSSASLPHAPPALEAQPYVSPYLHRVTLKELQPDTVYWLRLSGALVATSTTKDFAGRVELAEPFPVRTLRIPGPFVAPPQGLPMNLIDEWGAAESPALRIAVVGDLGHTLPLLSATVREALHADAFDVDQKKANGERKTDETSSPSASASPNSPPPPPQAPPTPVVGGRTALLWLVGGLAHADGDGTKWDAWGSALSDLIESLPVAAVASNHEIEVNPNTGQAFAHFRQRFRGPGEESEAEEVETEAAENKVSSSSSPLPFSEKEAIPKLNFDYDHGASYFSFNVGLVHFIGLNAYAHTAVGSCQYEWLVADLASVDRKTTPWVLAFVHGAWRRPEDDAASTPTTSSSSSSELNHDSRSDSGNNGVDISSGGDSSTSRSISSRSTASPSPQPMWSSNALKVQAVIEPLLIKHQVGVLFAASDGAYGRTYPLGSEGVQKDDHKRGMTFVAVGGGVTSPTSTTAKEMDDLNVPTPDSNSNSKPESTPSQWAVSNGAAVGRGDLLVVNETHLRWRWWATGTGALRGPDDDVWLMNPYGLLRSKANSDVPQSSSSSTSATTAMAVAAAAIILVLCFCRRHGNGKNNTGQAYDVLPTQKPSTTKYEWYNSKSNTSAATPKDVDGDSDSSSSSSGGGRYSERMRRLDSLKTMRGERSRESNSGSSNGAVGDMNEENRGDAAQRHARRFKSATVPADSNHKRALKPPPRMPMNALPPAATWLQLRENAALNEINAE